MGWNYRKTINIMPGVNLNLSKNGPSLSLGPKGMKYNINSHGSRIRCSIPGTGIYYTKNLNNASKHTKVNPSRNKDDGTKGEEKGIDELGFLTRLSLTSDEKQFLLGLKKFTKGDCDGAKRELSKCQLTDAYFLKGFIELGDEHYEGAKENFEYCLTNQRELGNAINKFSHQIELLLDVTEYIEVPILPNRRGLYLCIVECYQKMNQLEEGLRLLYELHTDNPSDQIVILSIIDFIALENSLSQTEISRVIQLTEGLRNDMAIETNIIYLRGYLFYRINEISLSIAELTSLIRKTKERPERLILDIRYLRGQIYEEIGDLSKAKKDYEYIYVKDSTYEGIHNKIFRS